MVGVKGQLKRKLYIWYEGMCRGLFTWTGEKIVLHSGQMKPILQLSTHYPVLDYDLRTKPRSLKTRAA